MYASAAFIDRDRAVPSLVLSAGESIAFVQRDRSGHPITGIALSDASQARAAPVRIRHYARDHSVFADGQYLIRGVAGAVLWKLLREYQELGRTEFCSRELRAAGKELGLPEICDNLSTRLHLLASRLDQIGAPIRLNRLGGGRIRLAVARSLMLETA